MNTIWKSEKKYRCVTQNIKSMLAIGLQPNELLNNDKAMPLKIYKQVNIRYVINLIYYDLATYVTLIYIMQNSTRGMVNEVFEICHLQCQTFVFTLNT